METENLSEDKHKAMKEDGDEAVLCLMCTIIDAVHSSYNYSTKQVTKNMRVKVRGTHKISGVKSRQTRV